jgi:hypothetical protein
MVLENPHFAKPTASDLTQAYSLTAKKNTTSLNVDGIKGVVRTEQLRLGVKGYMFHNMEVNLTINEGHDTESPGLTFELSSMKSVHGHAFPKITVRLDNNLDIEQGQWD